MTEENEWFPNKKVIEDYELLKSMLYSQKKEFDLLSKKKSDEQLNSMKIKMANRVLEPLKELFKHEESHKFLDTLNEDELPTNSDVVLIISQYETAIRDFKNKYYKNYQWITVDFLREQNELEEDYEDGE